MITQKCFAEALLDAKLPTPDGLTINGYPATNRFSVYRNNVIAGLSDVLTGGFPVLNKLVGDQFFQAMAALYITKFPPCSPILTNYGQCMPKFLANFAPVQNYPYLPDIARLELALRVSYHAADSTPVNVTAIQGFSEENINSAKITLAPSVQQIRSQYPIRSIWMANMCDQQLESKDAEDVLILRTEFDPEPTTHLPGGFEFITAIWNQRSLAEASLIAADANPKFDLTAVFSQLLAHNAITEIQTS